MERYFAGARNGSVRKHYAIDSRLCWRKREPPEEDDTRCDEKWCVRALDTPVQAENLEKGALRI